MTDWKFALGYDILLDERLYYHEHYEADKQNRSYKNDFREGVPWIIEDYHETQ